MRALRGPSVFLLLTAAAQAAPPVPGQKIDRIVIDVYDVFETDDPAEDTTLYSIANSVHMRTREAIVRREVLFREGDPYDAALLEETERNLRDLPFVRRAEVTGYVNSSGTLSVMVRAYDSWTLTPVFDWKRSGGVNDVTFGLSEHNVLGYGKTLALEYGKNGHDDSRRFHWADRQVWGSRLRNDLLVEDSPTSKLYSARLERPFFASIARWSYGLTGRYAEDAAQTYADDVLLGEDRKVTTEATGFVGYAVESTPRRGKRLTLGLEHLRHHWRLRPRQRLTFLRASAELKEFDFIKRRRIRKLSRLEDFNLGWEIDPSAAWAPRTALLGTTEDMLQPRLTLRKGWRLPDDGFILARHEYQSTYVNGSNGARVLGFDLDGFLLPHRRHTIALHAGYAHGWRLDPTERLTLGEDSGLRGYARSRFIGSQRVLLNAEDRVFFFENLLKLVDMGGVAFFDAGNVWPKGSGPRWKDLRKSVGLGLRVAATRSAANDPIRIDVARALDDNGQRSRWSVSILAGHAF